MSAKDKEMLQRIAEGMNALPEPEQKYVLGFAEGALAAANRPPRRMDRTRGAHNQHPSD